MRLKILSWNINGIRAAIKKGLWEKLNSLNCDIVCLQETKADIEIMADIFPKNKASWKDAKIIWHSSTQRKGYSGVATLFLESKVNLVDSQIGLLDEEFDIEGRTVITKFQVNQSNENFTLINAYYPQGGRGEHRIEYKMNFYDKIFKLNKNLQQNGEKVVLCGDFNTTVKDIDLARPAQNRKTTGCLPEERLALKWLLPESSFEPGQLEIVNTNFTKWERYKERSLNLIDSFRYFNPDLRDKYTYWDQITKARERNVGWRIDYFMLDQNLEKNLVSAEILDQVYGSDHCPVMVELEF